MPKRFAVLSLVLLFACSSGANEWVRGWHPNPFLGALTSPLGLATVGFTYAVLNGATTWIWAWNWALRSNVTAEQNARIQEAGGLASAVVTWVFGGFIPFYGVMYGLYVARMKKDAANGDANLQVRDDPFVEQVREQRNSIDRNQRIGS